jgi:hypothetical protein
MVAESLLNELNQSQLQQKQAADQFEHIIKSAQADAELYASFVSGLTKGAEFGQYARTKAAGCLPMSEEGSEGGESAMDAGGAPGGPGGGLPPEVMAQLAGGGGGGPGPEAGGAGGEGGGGGDEAVIEELAQALDQAGVTPEELAQAIAHSQGGGEGGEGGEGGPGPGPGAGGPPPEMAGKAASARVKMANALKSLVA